MTSLQWWFTVECELWAWYGRGLCVTIYRGPNRGHYISIVKSYGYWILFDDEYVEVTVIHIISNFTVLSLSSLLSPSLPHFPPSLPPSLSPLPPSLPTSPGDTASHDRTILWTNRFAILSTQRVGLHTVLPGQMIPALFAIFYFYYCVCNHIIFYTKNYLRVYIQRQCHNDNK